MSIRDRFGRMFKVRKAKSLLEEVFRNKVNFMLIHYSCESWIERTSSSSKITSIAIRDLETGQSHSFSIIHEAEKLEISLEDIPKRFEEIEKKLISNFFNFLNQSQAKTFIHWNMRDINYGFQAIEHRASILGVDTFVLPDSKKLDLSRILIERFGENYIDHPRLTKLIELNEISMKHFLNGQEEADAFSSGKYMDLHRSTLRKVDILDGILGKIENNNMRTKNSIIDRYGISISSLIELAQTNLLTQLLVLALTLSGAYDLIKKILVFFVK